MTTLAASTGPEPIANPVTPIPPAAPALPSATTVASALQAVEDEEAQFKAEAARDQLEAAARTAALKLREDAIAARRAHLLAQQRLEGEVANAQGLALTASQRLQTILDEIETKDREQASDPRRVAIQAELTQLRSERQAIQVEQDRLASTLTADLANDELLVRLTRADLAASAPSEPDFTSDQSTSDQSTSDLTFTSAVTASAVEATPTPTQPGPQATTEQPPTYDAAATRPEVRVDPLGSPTLCLHCNRLLPDQDAAFCPHCGLGQFRVKCQCGATIPGGIFCARCGRQFSQPHPIPTAAANSQPAASHPAEPSVGAVLRQRVLIGLFIFFIASIVAIGLYGFSIALPLLNQGSSTASYVDNLATPYSLPTSTPQAVLAISTSTAAVLIALAASSPTATVLATTLTDTPATATPSNTPTASSPATATHPALRSTTPSIVPIDPIVPILPIVPPIQVSPSATTARPTPRPTLPPTPTDEAAAAAVGITSVLAAPALTPPTTTPASAGAASHLSYPRLGIEAKIVTVGREAVRDAQGRIRSKDGLTLVRWATDPKYASLHQGSPTAGAAGRLVINGHNWGHGRGVFAALQPIQGGGAAALVGDELAIENAGGASKISHYVVTAVSIVSPTNITYLTLIEPRSSGSPELVLITCTAVDGLQRVVVQARLKEGN